MLCIHLPKKVTLTSFAKTNISFVLLEIRKGEVKSVRDTEKYVTRGTEIGASSGSLR